ncbi:MAG TPA: hypothetical protein VKX41_15850 [Alloacidobacterium sp.]|nr:hypothetical protein [Alloacidobacterium sp.]
MGDSRTVVFAVSIAAFLVSMAAIAVRSYRRGRRASGTDWEHLLKRLQVVNHNSVAEVALDIIDESGQRRRDDGSAALDSERIWELIGGLQGLEVLKANCEVLIELAFYVQQWYPDALVVAEQLRLSAREIEWNVDRLNGANRTGKLKSAFAMYAQPAVAAYYLMTRRLLALYEQGDLPMLPDLRRAL